MNILHFLTSALFLINLTSAQAPFTKLMVFGGQNANYKTEAIDLSAANRPCQPLRDCPFQHGSVATFMDGQVIVCGGYPSENDRMCFSYDPIVDDWNVAGSMLNARQLSAGVQLSPEEWWITGGYDENSPFNVPFQTTEMYSLGQGFSASVDLPEGKYDHNLVKINETHVMLVGDWGSRRAWMFDRRDSSWTELPELSNSRYGAQAGLVRYPDGRLEVLVAGGWREKTTEMFSLVENAWREGPELPVGTDLSGGASVQFGESFVIVGGSDDFVFKKDLYLFDVKEEQWVKMEQELKEGRDFFAAVLVPDDYVVC